MGYTLYLSLYYHLYNQISYKIHYTTYTTQQNVAYNCNASRVQNI